MRIFFYTISILFFITYNLCASILYENNFDDKPDWQSPNHQIAGLVTTHNEASLIGFTSYRVGRDDFGERLFVIDSVVAYGGLGKCLKVNYETLTGSWTGGGLDIHFADPNIGGIPEGYDELWIEWEWKFANGWQWGSHNYLKIFRAYSAVDYEQHWNNNWSLSSASNPAPGKTGYLIDDFIGPLVNYGPAYRPDTAYQTHSYQDYNCSWSDYFADSEWHNIMFHIKMNDVGDSNIVDEFYIDDTLRGQLGVPVILRTDSERKFNCLILFDNFYSDLADTIEQICYVDNIIIRIEETGIKKRKTNIFPNPCKVYMGQRYITFNNLVSNDIIKVFDISGKIIHNSGNIANNKYRWSVYNVSSGIYFYKVGVSSKASGKIVIIR